MINLNDIDTNLASEVKANDILGNPITVGSTCMQISRKYYNDDSSKFELFVVKKLYEVNKTSYSSDIYILKDDGRSFKLSSCSVIKICNDFINELTDKWENYANVKSVVDDVEKRTMYVMLGFFAKNKNNDDEFGIVQVRVKLPEWCCRCVESEIKTLNLNEDFYLGSYYNDAVYALKFELEHEIFTKTREMFKDYAKVSFFNFIPVKDSSSCLKKTDKLFKINYADPADKQGMKTDFDFWCCQEATKLLPQGAEDCAVLFAAVYDEDRKALADAYSRYGTKGLYTCQNILFYEKDADGNISKVHEALRNWMTNDFVLKLLETCGMEKTAENVSVVKRSVAKYFWKIECCC